LATRLLVWIASSAEGIANCTTLGLFVLDMYSLQSEISVGNFVLA
jgi:hypothetical protein